MLRIVHFCVSCLRRLQLSLFEKVILVNSIMLIGEALAGLWVTSHSLEAHHYLIDTVFLVLAALCSLLINVLLLRASFRPLFSLLRTMRQVSAGKTEARTSDIPSDSEIGELAHTFNSMLDRLEAMHREQATLILQAQEEERRRLALELHDESSQNLTALLVHEEILNQSLQALPNGAILPETRGQLSDGVSTLTQLTQSTLENIRMLSQQLRPSVLDDLGLHAALRWLAQDGCQRFHVAVELHLEGEEIVPIHEWETVLFRIAQESLTNVARHAHARHAWISLVQDAHSIRLQVRDDGCGYDPLQQHAGAGIFGMRERAALVGGKLTISSQPGQGTMVEVLLPLPQE